MNDRGRGFFRFIGWTSGVALVVVLALYVALSISWHFASEPPDVAGVARSQPVVTADQATASAISEDLKALAPAHTPWLVAGPKAVFDRCTSRSGESFEPGWGPTTCMRTVIAYFFSETPFQQHVQEWSTTLRASGWIATTLIPENNDYRWFPPAGSAAPTIDVDLSFAQRPKTSRLFEAASAAPDSEPAIMTTAWIQKSPVSTAALDSAPFAQYPYVAEVVLFSRYYDPSNPPTPSPTGNPASGQCFSGSGTCN